MKGAKKDVQIILLFLTAIVLVALFYRTNAITNYPEISLMPPEINSSPSMNNAVVNTVSPLRMAISSVVSPQRASESYHGLQDYLSSELGRPIELVLRSTYAEINQLIQLGHIDFALVCTWPYVQGRKDFDLELLVMPQIRGKTEYGSYIIVRSDSELETLSSLQGKIFAFTDPLSFSGNLYFTYRLALLGETPDSFLQQYLYTYSHDNSITAVAEGLVDGAAVASYIFDSMVKENPELGQTLKVIDSSHFIGTPPVVVHPRISPELKQQLIDAFLTMNKSGTGQRALAEMEIDHFILAEQAKYDYIEQILTELKEYN